MANFKGGFAFNNGPAKAEVEQAPDGTLISCVNPVTGEGLNAGNSKEVITGTTADPLPGVKIRELADALEAGNASAIMNIDGTALGVTDRILLSVSTTQIFTGDTLLDLGVTVQAATILSNNTLIMAVDTRWFGAYPANNKQKAYIGGTVADLPALPTVTNIYHHPMPE